MISIERNDLWRWASIAAFVAGLTAYIVFMLQSAPTRGLWYDEYWTLYFADPNSPAGVIFSDTNNPTYYLLLRVALLAGLEGQGAIAAANQVAVLALSAATLTIWALAKRPLFGLAALGAIFASPAAMTFALEGRFYAIAIFACVAFTAALLARIDTKSRQFDIWIYVLAVIASASHLFSAIYVGAAAASYVLLSARTSREDAIFSLTVGATAVVVTVAWIAVAWKTLFGPTSLVSWIQDSWGPTFIYGQFWFVNKMLAGVGPNVFLLVAGLAAASFGKVARPYIILLALTLAIFILLPSVASLWQPMLRDRYLSIPVSSFLLIGLFAVFRSVEDPPTLMRRAGMVLTGLFMAVLVVTSNSVAHRITNELRYPFQVAEARALLEGCANPRARIYVPALQTVGVVSQQAVYEYAYETALAWPDADLVSSRMPAEDVSAYPCQLVAWGELADFTRVSQQELLDILNLRNDGDAPLEVRHWHMGFAVVRSESATND